MRPESAYFQASTIAPRTISPAPIPSRKFSFSPRNAIASAIATTTLSLSIGATLETSPNLKCPKVTEPGEASTEAG